MIYLNSILDVIDNSGVLKFKYINSLSKCKKIKYGDILVGIVYKLYSNNLYKKSDKCKGILVQQKKFLNLKKYYSIKFNKNAVIILNNNLNSVGTKSNYYILKYIKNKLNINIKKLKIRFI
ncbi:apicoplast ribosomal protein L14, putative [Plasmodium knowlesi strain H]|uniref:Apicoplast ribosomal protein L14, putative n=3 Tax=Plasmodium knowlesi TaxID=5850 RepID=A0A679L8I9_PLAKH|nr:ribosomal protein L14 [Plasmodium knowlesi strain H]BBB58079.1 large subunit ribosomal protein 14 [Plasmodium knowlesi]CAA9991338.1 apicoplast ribosomal protein L14, putative [Plasmodium knowlesi strain H]SBO27214.1 apicoplast ribosomal protein L14, putative [Plasmodium knowlesi strain H]VVS80812.1 apicoplast ribosomal protein L14, putative [Plasmodium knowlesi strain H]